MNRRVLADLSVLNMRQHVLTVVWLMLAASSVPAMAQTNASPDISPFVVVLIDAKTERAIGPFPYDRRVLAQGVQKAAGLNARAVVLKFFLDRAKTEEGDRALAEAMRNTKVVLQARLDATEANPNSLPDRFRLKALSASDDAKALAGRSGWIPLPVLSERAHAIGFVDSDVPTRVPILEKYGQTYVKSLATCCLELALGGEASIRPGDSLRIGEKHLALDVASQAAIRFPAEDRLPYVSFASFIRGDVPPESIKDRIVIIGYDGDKIGVMDTPLGRIRLHRAFCYGLLSLYEQLRR